MRKWKPGRKRRLYLSGTISGIEVGNWEVFQAAAKMLRRAGYAGREARTARAGGDA